MRREFAEKRRAEERQEQLTMRAERLQYDFDLLSSSRPPSADDNFSEVCRGLQSGEACGIPPPRPSSPGLSISSFSSDGYWDRRPSQLLLRNDPTARAEHRERELLRDAQRCGPRTWAVLRLLLLGLSQEGSSPFNALDIDVVRQIMYHIIVTRLSFVRSSEVALVPGSPWHAILERVRPTLLLPPPARMPPAAYTPLLPNSEHDPLHQLPPPQAAPPVPLPAIMPPPGPDEDEQQVPGPPGAAVPLFMRGGRGRGRGRGLALYSYGLE